MRKFRNILRTNKDIIIAVALCFVGFGGLLFGAVPAVRATIVAITEIRSLDSNIDRLNKKVAILDSLSEEALRNQITVITSAIPVDKSVPTVFSTIDNLTEKAGITVNDMSVTQVGSFSTVSAQKLTSEEKTLGASVLPFELTISGSFDAVRTFISHVGSVRRLLRIKNFDIALLPNGLFQSRLSLDAFYVPLPTTIAKVDDMVTNLTGDEQETLTKLAAYPWISQSVINTVRRPLLGTKQNPFAR